MKHKFWTQKTTDKTRMSIKLKQKNACTYTNAFRKGTDRGLHASHHKLHNHLRSLIMHTKNLTIVNFFMNTELLGPMIDDKVQTSSSRKIYLAGQ